MYDKLICFDHIRLMLCYGNGYNSRAIRTLAENKSLTSRVIGQYKTSYILYIKLAKLPNIF